MLQAERRQQLLNYLAYRKSAQLQELCGLVEASSATIRRDLTQMEAEGLLRRVHGGAVCVESQGENPVFLRRSQQAGSKRRIARAAAGLIQDGDTVVITGDTTTEMMVPFLVKRRDLTVITNAIPIAHQLSQYPQIGVVVLGGWLRHSELSLVGHLVEQDLQDFRVDKVFYGIYGLDPAYGLTGFDVEEAQTDRHLIQSASRLFILADQTKFHQAGRIRLAPIERITAVITDTGAPEECVRSLLAKGIQVIQV